MRDEIIDLYAKVKHIFDEHGQKQREYAVLAEIREQQNHWTQTLTYSIMIQIVMLEEIEPQVKQISPEDLPMFKGLKPKESVESLILASVLQDKMKQQWTTQKFYYEDDVVTPLSYFMSIILGCIVVFILLEFMVLYCTNVAFSADPDDVPFDDSHLAENEAK